ncbi:DUF6542 domain-containing protein [Blastococcus sp. SYSU D00695]
MASVSAADTWRDGGARSDRSAGGPARPSSGGRPGERPARPPLPPLPPLPSHGRSGAPGPRPAVPAAAQRPPAQRPSAQGRPTARPQAPAADRGVPPRPQSDPARVTPGYPRPSASLASDAGRRRPRPDLDEAGPAAGAPRAPRRPAPAEAPETGSRLRGSLAVVGMFAITLLAGFLDAAGSPDLGLVTLVGLVGGTALATLLVRRRDLVTPVIAPPLVYLAVVAVLQFVHRTDGDGLKQVVAKIAAELALGQGFTVMAAATGTGLVLALIRWAARR